MGATRPIIQPYFLSAVNMYVSATNGSQRLQTLLIFLQYLHQAPMIITRVGVQARTESATLTVAPNRYNNMLFEFTDKSGAEDNGDDANHAPCPASRTALPSMRLQGKQERQYAIGLITQTKNKSNPRDIAHKGSGKELAKPQ